MKEILPCTLNLSVAAEMTRRHFSLSNDTLESATTHFIKEEEAICDLLANEEDHEESKDVSDANYPDLLYTLRKALISSYSEEKHNLITLSWDNLVKLNSTLHSDFEDTFCDKKEERILWRRDEILKCVCDINWNDET